MVLLTYQKLQPTFHCRPCLWTEASWVCLWELLSHLTVRRWQIAKIQTAWLCRKVPFHQSSKHLLDHILKKIAAKRLSPIRWQNRDLLTLIRPEIFWTKRYWPASSAWASHCSVSVHLHARSEIVFFLEDFCCCWITDSVLFGCSGQFGAPTDHKCSEFFVETPTPTSLIAIIARKRFSVAKLTNRQTSDSTEQWVK